jgi:hypothetical protein
MNRSAGTPGTMMDRSPWHALPAPQALAALQFAAHGLTAAEAARRLAEYGRNELDHQQMRVSAAVHSTQRVEAARAGTTPPAFPTGMNRSRPAQVRMRRGLVSSARVPNGGPMNKSSMCAATVAPKGCRRRARFARSSRHRKSSRERSSAALG